MTQSVGPDDKGLDFTGDDAADTSVDDTRATSAAADRQAGFDGDDESTDAVVQPAPDRSAESHEADVDAGFDDTDDSA